MGRKFLIWYPGASYHVTTRGNNKRDIFLDDQDRKVYLSALSESIKKYKCILECYCLMTNHTHLLITTTESKISDAMRILDLKYTKYFNRKYDLIGHLFQGRFSAELIDNNAYIVEASKYIHLNPVKAKIVSAPEDYKWSSYGVYINAKKNTAVNTEKILSCFGNSKNTYKLYIERFLKQSGT